MNARRGRSGILTDRRAISPLVATLILILIAVVGGGMVYVVFSNQAKSLSKTTDIQVQSASIASASGTVVISVTVKNTGTIAVDSVDVKVYGDEGGSDSLLIGSLDPGETGGDTLSATGVTATYEVGKSYVMEFSAKVNGDVVATRSLTVTVSG